MAGTYQQSICVIQALIDRFGKKVDGSKCIETREHFAHTEVQAK